MKQIITPFVLGLALCVSATACDTPEEAAPQAEKPKPEPKKDTVDPAVLAEAQAALSMDMSKLDPKVQKAVKVAMEIEATPDDADAILEKHELDREALDALMYEIARSPELSASYRDARMSS